MDKKLFILKRKNAVLWAMNAYLDIGSNNDKFIFEDILMQSFLDAFGRMDVRLPNLNVSHVQHFFR